VILLPLLACQSPSQDQHFARALGIERQLLRSHPEADYSHPGYISVLRSLRAVPSSAKEKGRAQGLAQRITDGRRFAITESYAQIDYLPTRLVGREKPVPARPGSKAAGPPRGQSPRRAAAAGQPPSSGPSSASLSELTEAQKSRLDVTLYSTTWCGYCKKARRWLASNGIPYIEKDVEKDPAGASEFRELTGGRGGVPVITVGQDVIRGFSERRLEQAIKRAAKGG
jgi:glutaredoxin